MHVYDPAQDNTVNTESTSNMAPSLINQLMMAYAINQNAPVTGVVPHIIGPAGAGKSSTIYELGKLTGSEVHTINVARINPMELEGIEMPHTDTTKRELMLLHSARWKRMKDGDIVFLEEFMRGFPEVYNALLDIITAREVAGLKLPKLFFVAASNSDNVYDPALEDRLIHIPVADPRRNSTAHRELTNRFLVELGLPANLDSLNSTWTSLWNTASELLRTVTLPMFDVIDTFGPSGSKATRAGSKTAHSGLSIRHLTGAINSRMLPPMSPHLRDLKTFVAHVNQAAIALSMPQYLILLPEHKFNNPSVEAFIEARPQLMKTEFTEATTRNIEANTEVLAIILAERK